MTAKITEKLPNPEGVVAGGTATFRIPTGRRFHELYFVYDYNATTQNIADFLEFRIYLNGQLYQQFSGVQRDTMNQFDRLGASTGVLVIPFDRKGMRLAGGPVGGEEETAINTRVTDKNGRQITSMYMEVDLDAGMTITPDDLSLYAKQSDPVAGGAGTLLYIRNEQRSAAGATSDFQISDLVNPGVNAPDKMKLSRVTFIPSTGTINSLKISRNSYSIFDRPDSLNRVIQNDGRRTAQAGYYTIDPSENGNSFETIELFGMTDYRYRLDVSAAMTIQCMSEYLGILTA